MGTLKAPILILFPLQALRAPISRLRPLKASTLILSHCAVQPRRFEDSHILTPFR